MRYLPLAVSMFDARSPTSLGVWLRANRAGEKRHYAPPPVCWQIEPGIRSRWMPFREYDRSKPDQMEGRAEPCGFDEAPVTEVFGLLDFELRPSASADRWAAF